jgi:adenosylcobinamide kinase/adenosylcobinamide-phosphate guanylyltransferase
MFNTGGEQEKVVMPKIWPKELAMKPIYVATARKWDDDFQKDRSPSKDRDEYWINIEKEKRYLSEINLLEMWHCRLCYLVAN